MLPHLTDFGQGELYTPNLGLASKSVFTAKLEFLVQTLLLERTTRSLGRCAVCYACMVKSVV